MLDQVKRVLQNREHAGRLLAEQLSAYKNSNAIVVAVPRGGVPVGYHLAKKLQLPLEIVVSKRIKHPAHSEKSIGAVSIDDVVLQESSYTIPQHYIYHQITQLQSHIQQQHRMYHENCPEKSVTGKTVILTDDFIRETDCLYACLHSIEKQDPKKIIIAVPITSSKAALLLTQHKYQFIYLFMVMHQHLNMAMELFPEVSEDEVEILLCKATEELQGIRENR